MDEATTDATTTAAALRLAAEWEAKAARKRSFADQKLKAGNAIPAWIALAAADELEDCARALRDATTEEAA